MLYKTCAIDATHRCYYLCVATQVATAVVHSYLQCGVCFNSAEVCNQSQCHFITVSMGSHLTRPQCPGPDQNIYAGSVSVASTTILCTDR